MTIYISPFIGGIIIGAIGTLILIIALGLVLGKRKGGK